MKKIVLLSTALLFLTSSCSVYETMVNLSRLKFKLGAVNNFTVSGINISGKKSLQDFNPLEVVNLTSVIASGKLPVSFTLNVEAKNPNDGTGGYPKTDATLKAFPWRLEIDNVETISGNIGSPVTVPGTGEVTNIPLTMNIDLIEFFGNKGFDNLINLALTLGGQQGSSTRLSLFASPTVSSPVGDIKYPGELKIVDQSFTN
ncbi:MAG: hypothetical protein HND39_00960 [Ignavibacteriota bacterium]|jgi:hypothetical protein|nr:hypothetical protein [Ignavibacteriales bacterium]MBL1122845.1 hypothetical protein [Ignavibacteriota bacterium]MCC7093211.1 hypothetical protein [Ignavibacteriaceae bacterium]MCZ7612220.1 hypothetical protein [Ignavibacteriaceae bacterium]NUM63041.1 hypothetical protein [Ignavibacteriaceae bacterium]